MTGDETGERQSALVGTWRKATTSPEASLYPEGINFDERGIYTTDADPAGRFTIWDSGGYQVVGPGQVRISTATDAEPVYPFRVSDDVLHLTLPDGEVIEYRRLR